MFALRCVVVHVFVRIFLYIFLRKEKAIFSVSIVRNDNNTHDDDDDDELDAIYHTRTTLPKIEQSK